MASYADAVPCKVPLVSFTWAGLTRPVHAGILEDVKWVRAEWEKRGGQDWYEIRSWWGFAPRDCKTGAHPRGLAVDVNPAENPMVAKRTPCPSDMPPEFIALFKARGFGHGADWRSKCDAMHFSKAPNEGGDGVLYRTAPVSAPPQPAPASQEEPDVKAFQYDDDLDVFYVESNGELVTRYYMGDAWNRLVLAGGCAPRADVEVVRDFRGEKGRLDVFAKAKDSGVVHAWYGPGGQWLNEVLP